MKNYIGTKIIKAEPMGKREFERTNTPGGTGVGEDQPGYRVVYTDGYVSWSPEGIFDLCHREVLQAELELLNTGRGEKEVEAPTMGIKKGDALKSSKE